MTLKITEEIKDSQIEQIEASQDVQKFVWNFEELAKRFNTLNRFIDEASNDIAKNYCKELHYKNIHKCNIYDVMKLTFKIEDLIMDNRDLLFYIDAINVNAKMRDRICALIAEYKYFDVIIDLDYERPMEELPSSFA